MPAGDGGAWSAPGLSNLQSIQGLAGLPPEWLQVDPKPETWNPKPETRNPKPYTPYPIPFTLHPTPYTLNPEPYTLHPQP